MGALTIENHGPLITATNYWGSEIERAGKLYCSCNAGAVRVLLPRRLADLTREWHPSKYVILSRGPLPEQRLPDAVELLFEDHTDSPFALHLSPESFDLLPAQPEAGREWILSVWVQKKGKPHKAMERPVRWRRSEQLPDLRPWEEG